MGPILLPGLEREVDLARGGNAEDLKNAGMERKFLEARPRRTRLQECPASATKNGENQVKTIQTFVGLTQCSDMDLI